MVWGGIHAGGVTDLTDVDNVQSGAVRGGFTAQRYIDEVLQLVQVSTILGSQPSHNTDARYCLATHC